MKKYHYISVIAVIFVCIFSSNAISFGSAAEILKKYYAHINGGEYKEAKALYSEVTIKFIKENLGDKFSEWADNETKHGSIKEIKILKEIKVKSYANYTKVEYDIIYNNGEMSKRFVPVFNKKFGYELGMIGVRTYSDKSKFIGSWKGYYFCGQGKSGLNLIISEEESKLKAIFNFYPLAENPKAKSGSYSMVGEEKADGTFLLNPDAWIDQPPGYYMVGMAGKIDEKFTTLAGDIPGCKTFLLRKKGAISPNEESDQAIKPKTLVRGKLRWCAGCCDINLDISDFDQKNYPSDTFMVNTYDGKRKEKCYKYDNFRGQYFDVYVTDIIKHKDGFYKGKFESFADSTKLMIFGSNPPKKPTEISLPTGFHAIKLGMNYGEVKKNLMNNGFERSKGDGNNFSYNFRGPIPSYPFASGMSYKFNRQGRNFADGYTHIYGIIKSRKTVDFFTGVKTGKFDVDSEGLSFLPADHYPPSSDCHYPTDYVGKRVNFPLFDTDKLLSFEVKIMIKEEYRKDFFKIFTDSFSEQFGAPNAETLGFGNASWYDTETLVTVMRGGIYQDSIRIAYKSLNERDLLIKLKELELLADRRRKECIESKENKIMKSIKIQ